MVNNQLIKIKPDVLSQEVSGETVILNLNNESYFGLDETGTRFWQLLHEYDEIRIIIDKMLDEFDVDKEQLVKDLADLKNKMLEAGLIEIIDSD